MRRASQKLLGLTWAIGFERELRGAAAGDRTFALIGVGSAVICYLALDHAPNALAGVVTGIGFIGAGLIVHGALPNRPGAPDGADVDVDAGNRAIGRIRGVTTAATIYLAAKYHDAPREGLIANTHLGGDNVHRGAVLGAILGAANGAEAWPEDWRNGLLRKPPLLQAMMTTV